MLSTVTPSFTFLSLWTSLNIKWHVSESCGDSYTPGDNGFHSRRDLSSRSDEFQGTVSHTWHRQSAARKSKTSIMQQSKQPIIIISVQEHSLEMLPTCQHRTVFKQKHLHSLRNRATERIMYIYYQYVMKCS